MNPLLLCLPLAVIGSWAAPAEGITVLPPRQLTEGSRAEIHVSAPDHAGKSLGWRVGIRNNTLAEGRMSVGKDGGAELTLEAPTLRTNEALPLTLRISGPGKVTVETKLWVFPKDPLRELKARLRERPLRLYDPPGGTAIWLRSLGVPHKRVSRPEEVEDGVLLVGEGEWFVVDPELAARLRRMAVSGVKVLCLRPDNGEAKLIEWDLEPVASELFMAGEEFFADLYPRLEGSGLAFQKFQLHSGDHWLVLDFRAPTGWSWAEFRYPGGGVLAFSGAKVRDTSGESLVSALWLNAMLDVLDSRKPQRENKNE